MIIIVIIIVWRMCVCVCVCVCVQPFFRAAGLSCACDTWPLRLRFWSECLHVVERCSGDMLRINQRPAMFAGLLHELMSFSAAKPPPPRRGHTQLPMHRHQALSPNVFVRNRPPLTHRHTVHMTRVVEE